MDVIWGAQSALSASNDLRDLRMARWDRYYTWSPWNCVLLTKDEVAAHLKVENMEKVGDTHTHLTFELKEKNLYIYSTYSTETELKIL